MTVSHHGPSGVVGDLEVGHPLEDAGDVVEGADRDVGVVELAAQLAGRPAAGA
jgi:hypothetical protein